MQIEIPGTLTGTIEEKNLYLEIPGKKYTDFSEGLALGGKIPSVGANFGRDNTYHLGRLCNFSDLFTFSRASVAWKLNALGHWAKVLAGEPRIGHHVWKDGKLVPAGIAVCSEARTNLVRYSEALDVSAHWPQTHGISVEPAGELSGIPAFRLTDANTDGFSQINQTGVTHGGGVHVFKMLIAKDQNPTSNFSIRLVYSVDEVSKLSGMSVNVDAGTSISNWNDNVLERKVEDCGDHWFVWFAVDLTGAGSVVVQLFPAHYNENGASGSVYVGSHVCTAVHFHPGRYPQDYIKTEAAPVSVASESLEIDPVKLAKAVGVLGPELAGVAPTTVNAPWVDNGNDTFTIDGAQTGNNYLYWAGLLEVSEKYVVETKVTDFVSSGTIGLVSSSVSVNFEVTGNGVYSEIVSGGGVNFNVNAKGDGFAGTVELLSVRKVTMPEVLTFVIKGFMTYEDGNQWSELVPFRLQNTDPTLEKIAFELSTLDARTGQMYFAHMSNSTLNAGTASADNKSPGPHVPFSYAWTIGDGISAAASDGVLVTGNAPTPLANILGAVADFTYRGDFCLTEFAIYVGNPGSAALQEATA